MKEHDEFVEENGDAPAGGLDSFLCGAARTEHYEIAAYTGLVTTAQALGKADAARLLQENLADEKALLEKAAQARSRLVGTAPASA